jgi:hypothetical protein
MKNKLTVKQGIVGLVGVFALVIAAAASQAVTVANASFENPSVASQPNGFEYDPTLAEQGGTGWSFHDDTTSTNAPDGRFGIAANGGFLGGMFNAPDGTQAGLLQRISDMEQSISGFSAGSYIVSFYAEGRNFNGVNGGANPLQVSIDGTLLTFGISGNTITPPVATTFTLYQSDPFTVAAGTHALEFSGTDAGFGGNSDLTSFIDAVSVTAIPEPTTFALVMLGATALLFRRRRHARVL